MYGTGKGVPVNYVKAYMWYSLAQVRSHELPTSGDRSMFMVNAGNLDIVKKLMTPLDRRSPAPRHRDVGKD